MNTLTYMTVGGILIDVEREPDGNVTVVVKSSPPLDIATGQPDIKFRLSRKQAIELARGLVKEIDTLGEALKSRSFRLATEEDD